MDARRDNPPTTSSTTTITNLPLEPGTWALDKAHSRVGFAVHPVGLAKVRGFFADVDAELVVGSSLEDTTVHASIATASIDTALPARDAGVRGTDVLDVERRPTMSFVSTGIRGAGAEWTLGGELTIGDVTRPISLEVELHGVTEVISGGRHAGFEARGELRRRDFGLSFGPLDAMLGQVVELQFDLEFAEPT